MKQRMIGVWIAALAVIAAVMLSTYAATRGLWIWVGATPTLVVTGVIQWWRLRESAADPSELDRLATTAVVGLLALCIALRAV